MPKLVVPTIVENTHDVPCPEPRGCRKIEMLANNYPHRRVREFDRWVAAFSGAQTTAAGTHNRK